MRVLGRLEREDREGRGLCGAEEVMRKQQEGYGGCWAWSGVEGQGAVDKRSRAGGSCLQTFVIDFAAGKQEVV